MNIVFFSNYFNHHQKFIAEALYADTKGSFRFYETSKMSEERKKLGYGEDHHPDYVSSYLQADCAVDADIVIFIYREDYYRKPNDPNGSAENNLAEVNVAKNRHGSTGTVKMGWYGQYYRFIEGTDEYDEPGESQ